MRGLVSAIFTIKSEWHQPDIWRRDKEHADVSCRLVFTYLSQPLPPRWPHKRFNPFPLRSIHGNQTFCAELLQRWKRKLPCSTICLSKLYSAELDRKETHKYMNQLKSTTGEWVGEENKAHIKSAFLFKIQLKEMRRKGKARKTQKLNIGWTENEGSSVAVGCFGGKCVRFNCSSLEQKRRALKRICIPLVSESEWGEIKIYTLIFLKRGVMSRLQSTQACGKYDQHLSLFLVVLPAGLGGRLGWGDGGHGGSTLCSPEPADHAGSCRRQRRPLMPGDTRASGM